jgi:diguanylate cyclase (GGDEF)-like protein
VRSTLAYLDLDNFKQVNDSFGHETGNELLVMIAQAISHHVRNTDFVARVGGDEFCILMPHTDSDAAKSLLGKVQDLLLSEMKKRNWPVTLSIGGVTFVRPPKSAREMIQAADALMYSVKSTGKNRIAQTVLPSSASPPAAQ